MTITMDKYKTSTFLTGLFCKVHLHDKAIRKGIAELYGTYIDSILTETSEEKRILMFKSLIPVIRSTIEYFEDIKKNGGEIDQKLFQTVSKLVAHCTHVVQKVGIRNAGSTKVFNDIMRQLLVDEISCDIGECISSYKNSVNNTEKKEITARLSVLLVDYNSIMRTKLTLDDILVCTKDA